MGVGMNNKKLKSLSNNESKSSKFGVSKKKKYFDQKKTQISFMSESPTSGKIKANRANNKKH